MKNIILIVVGLLCFGTVAAQETPRADARQAIQKERIKAGVQSGELTALETRRLVKEQKRIRRLERRSKADGNVSPAEKLRLEKAQHRANRKIVRKKNNTRDRN